MPQHLMFRAANGSLTWAGKAMLALGIFLLFCSLCEVIAATVWGVRTRNNRAVQIVLGAWGTLGLVAGGFFVAWPFLAVAGRLY